MAYTVNSAFKQFHENIKLNKSDSERARSSRDNLFSNIDKFPNEDDMFPLLYRECHNKFGSFARKTKISPLDDIDILVCLHARGSKYSEHLLIRWILQFLKVLILFENYQKVIF